MNTFYEIDNTFYQVIENHLKSKEWFPPKIYSTRVICIHEKYFVIRLENKIGCFLEPTLCYWKIADIIANENYDSLVKEFHRLLKL